MNKRSNVENDLSCLDSIWHATKQDCSKWEVGGEVRKDKPYLEIEIQYIVKKKLAQSKEKMRIYFSVRQGLYGEEGFFVQSLCKIW